MKKESKMAVVIPCFRVSRQIVSVVNSIPAIVDIIVVVDDACPEGSGKLVAEKIKDPRVQVLRLKKNLGVGGAVLTGMRHAVQCGADILVKIDGDGQHDANYIPFLVEPIMQGKADYTKGNRFYRLENLNEMPGVRIAGNAGLSFLSKLSSGYWNLMDPTNGFVAIHARVLGQLPLEKISQRYFFESDILFRLGTIRAKVTQVPMQAIYGDEVSGINPAHLLWPMIKWHGTSLGKRFFYNYFLRGFSLASLYLIFGIILLILGGVLGLGYWHHYAGLGVNAPTGTVMLVVLMIIVGMNFMFNFLSYDMASEPREVIHTHLPSTLWKPEHNNSDILEFLTPNEYVREK